MTHGKDSVEFLRRSFFTVDGLWFVNSEKELGFDRALELDRRVWESMAKVQARKARELCGGELGLAGLVKSLVLKFESEGWGFEVEERDGEARFRIIECPWYKILEKSERTHLEPTITKKICSTEYPLWAGEFGGGISFALEKEDPGSGTCCMVFNETEQ